MKPEFQLNMLGIVCPDFGYSLRAFFRDNAVPPGSVIAVTADAHNAERDVQKLCEFGGHCFMEKAASAVGTTYLIRKGV